MITSTKQTNKNFSMKLLKYLLFLVLILIIGTAIYVAVQPNSYEFQRSRVMEVPAAVVFDKVNDYKEWPSFSPWHEMDPEANITYGQTAVGEGASYTWDGDDLGEGGMKTISTKPHSQISQSIEFVEPFESQANINWSFEPTENGTKVIWSMDGQQDFKTKFFTALMGPIEKETGPQFERSLEKLDSLLVEDIKTYSIKVDGMTEHSGGFYIYNTASSKIEDVQDKIDEMMPKVGGYALANNISRAGSPFVIYHRWDEENGTVMFSCCIPTSSKMMTSENDILTGQLEPFRALKTTLNGNYNNLQEAWDKTMAYIAEHPITAPVDGKMIQTYVNNAEVIANPKNYITELFIEVADDEPIE